jgi:D-glycero-D-manno-heptose 1,7-bisphosphate phosphatase
MVPALFLDRDGVIIENRPGYVRSWSDVLIYPQALYALSKIASTSYKIFIVTNQSPIGRGLMTKAAADSINTRLLREIRDAGGRIDGVFMCPHAPQKDCDCRKPRPGLIYQAARTHLIDLSHSILVGDALTDIQAGQAAGLGTLALVLTGRGAAQLSSYPKPRTSLPFQVFDDLEDALHHLIPSI